MKRIGYKPLALLFLICGVVCLFAAVLYPRKTLIGATATVTEVSSGLEIRARVDTGAAISSLHYLSFEIEDESDEPQENVGKPARLLLENRDGDQQWVETKIVDFGRVYTTEGSAERYFVQLKLRCQGIEKTSTVNLNDRSNMSHHLLLGRNFLGNDFLVDISQDGEGPR